MSINTKLGNLMSIFDRLIDKAKQKDDSGKIKGLLAEQKVARALQRLVNQSLIADYFYSGPIIELDGQGKDFLLKIDSSQKKFIPLQVKSSKTGMLNHLAKQASLKEIYPNIPEIPVVVAYGTESDNDVKEKIKNILHLS